MKPHGTYKQLHPQENPPKGADAPSPSRRPRGALLSAVLLAFLLLLLLLLLLFLFFFFHHLRPSSALGVGAGGHPGACGDTCRIVLVESIPEGMTFGDGSPLNPSTFFTWMNLLGSVTRSLDIASFYWTMTNEDTRTHEPSAAQGERILEELLQLPRRGVAVRVAVSRPSAKSPLNDLLALEQSGATVRAVDLPQLTGGVLHTKLWLVDGVHLYVGSANMDWRSLTQVKELGVAVYNCSCLARDLGKIFEAYWALGVPGASIPAPWPANYSTAFNMETPLELKLNGTDSAVYFSSSPPPLCAAGRTQDLGALLDVIDAAEDFVYVAVMSYLPTTEFSRPESFWPAIDDRLRKAAFERRVAVRLLVGCWRHSRATMFPFLRSLAALADNRTGYGVEVVGVAAAALPAGPRVGAGEEPDGGLVVVPLLPTEALHGADHRGPSPDPLRPGQPQQVHGDGEGGVCRDVQLVRGLLHADGGLGAGGQPNGEPRRRWHRPPAAPGGLQAGLELPVQRRHRRRGALGDLLRPHVGTPPLPGLCPLPISGGKNNKQKSPEKSNFCWTWRCRRGWRGGGPGTPKIPDLGQQGPQEPLTWGTRDPEKP